MDETQNIPGWEGAVGPFPNQYGKPHVYARDVHSGSGNCVCGTAPDHRRHVQAEPDPDIVTVSRAALLGLFSMAFMRDDFLLTHGQLAEIMNVLGDDAVIPTRSAHEAAQEEETATESHASEKT